MIGGRCIVYKVTDSVDVASRDSEFLPRVSQHALRERRVGAALAKELTPKLVERLATDFADSSKKERSVRRVHCPARERAATARPARMRMWFDRKSLGACGK